MKARQNNFMAHGRPFSAKLPGRGGAPYRARETIAMLRKSKHEDEFGSRVAEFAMASWDMQCTQSYVMRPRCLRFRRATPNPMGGRRYDDGGARVRLRKGGLPRTEARGFAV